jgi:hypothetical protein
VAVTRQGAPTAIASGGQGELPATSPDAANASWRSIPRFTYLRQNQPRMPPTQVGGRSRPSPTTPGCRQRKYASWRLHASNSRLVVGEGRDSSANSRWRLHASSSRLVVGEGRESSANTRLRHNTKNRRLNVSKRSNEGRDCSANSRWRRLQRGGDRARKISAPKCRTVSLIAPPRAAEMQMRG